MDLASNDVKRAMESFWRKCANSPKCKSPHKECTKKDRKKKIRCESEEADTKKRQQKNAHNLIERRRRIQINDRINELATLLPRDSAEPFGHLIDMHCSDKSGILKSTVEYIKCLKHEVSKLQAEANRFRDLEKINHDLVHRIKVMELEELPSSINFPLDLPSFDLEEIFTLGEDVSGEMDLSYSPDDVTQREITSISSITQSNPDNLLQWHPSPATDGRAFSHGNTPCCE
ncbi:hypothetical protein DMENIID0001_017420 [Sergentomyia squamirostris]